MATISGYACTGVSPDCVVIADVIDGKALESLAGLLPQGKAWTRDLDSEMMQLVLALSHEYSRVRRRGKQLLEELDPRTTLELLEDWEHVYDITPSISATVAERRQALHAKMLRRMGQYREFYQTLAASVGANDVDFSWYPIATCASNCTVPLYDWRWRSAWLTTISGVVSPSVITALEDTFLASRQLQTYPLFSYAGSWGSTAIIPGEEVESVSQISYDGSGMWAVACSGFGLYTSSDLATWTSRDTGLDYVKRVAYVEGLNKWVATGSIGAHNTAVSLSSDGLTWSETDLSGTVGVDVQLLSIAYNGTVLLLAGDPDGVISSNGGGSWSAIDTGHYLTNIVVKSTTFYGVDRSSGVCYSSADGSSWSELGSTGVPGAAYLAKDSDGRLLSIGYDADTSPIEARASTSADSGVSWTRQLIPFVNVQGGENFTGLEFDADDRIVILTGLGNIHIADDFGEVWSKYTVDFDDPDNDWASCFVSMSATDWVVGVEGDGECYTIEWER